MSKLLVVMDSGKEYLLKDTSYDKFRFMIQNNFGVIFNYLIEIEEYIINPNHISSVEIVD